MIEPALLVPTFIAGVLTFLAPCTLPLLPAYLGFISGATEHELRAARDRYARARVLAHALLFVLGFSTIFITFGALAGALGAVLAPARAALEVAGGMLILVFGLFLLGALNLPVLAATRRVRMPAALSVGTPTSSLLLGGAFALGWTPCIGPILGTVLFVAGSTETLGSGVLLLIIFSLGFAIPFVLLALLIGHAALLVERATPYLNIVSKLGGFVLVMLGLSTILGDTMLTRWFFELFRFLDFEDTLLPYL